MIQHLPRQNSREHCPAVLDIDTFILPDNAGKIKVFPPGALFSEALKNERLSIFIS
ncbi:MAG TPA: hypothetical protein IAC82_10800 [Candidatus Merdivicinus intestinigallinarum]|nr:hypothetical protein [Candidatus Merdivicinus intestinigallinarum]